MVTLLITTPGTQVYRQLCDALPQRVRLKSCRMGAANGEIGCNAACGSCSRGARAYSVPVSRLCPSSFLTFASHLLS